MKKKIEFDKKTGEVLAPNKNIVARKITRGKSSYKPVKTTEKKSKVSTPKYTEKVKKEVIEKRKKQHRDFFKQTKKK